MRMRMRDGGRHKIDNLKPKMEERHLIAHSRMSTHLLLVGFLSLALLEATVLGPAKSKREESVTGSVARLGGRDEA
jgi:hypothetical protein